MAVKESRLPESIGSDNDDDGCVAAPKVPMV